MFDFRKLALTSVVCVSLTGCFEVEDNNNTDYAQALEVQNAALLAQKTPITLFGTVIDAGSELPITDATVTIKVGADWLAPINVSGEFLITDLPANTDVIVLVDSPTGAFMKRAFYGQTENVAAGQVAQQSIGYLAVSEGVVKTYSILNAENSEPFEGLSFVYNTSAIFSNISDTSSKGNYKVASSYDANSGLYQITLPKDLEFSLTASGDIDGDGVVDFTTENNDFWRRSSITLDASEALQLQTLFVNETAEYMPIELRISVVDELGNKMEGLEFFASDKFLGRLETSYDTDTKEHVFNYQTSSTVELNMPSFTNEDDVTFSSASIKLTWASEDTLILSDSGFINDLPSMVDVVDGVAKVTVLPDEMTSYEYNRAITTNVDETNNYSLKQFYQAPIALVENSVELTQNNVFTVIKGNDSDTDLVPAGVTQMGLIAVDVPVTTTLNYDDTFLTSTPDNVLTPGSYKYQVVELINRETGATLTRYANSSFVIEKDLENTTFDINDIRLDNNNGTTNGLAILTTNTAGEANTATDSRSGTRLYFPESIRSLDYLKLNLISSIRNGTSYSENREIRVIDGENVFVQIRNLVSLARNEQVESLTGGSYYQADTLTALTDGTWYYTTNASIYSNDDTSAQANSATFTYIYRVAGEDTVHEGTITLPVL